MLVYQRVSLNIGGCWRTVSHQVDLGRPWTCGQESLKITDWKNKVEYGGNQAASLQSWPSPARCGAWHMVAHGSSNAPLQSAPPSSGCWAMPRFLMDWSCGKAGQLVLPTLERGFTLLDPDTQKALQEHAWMQRPPWLSTPQHFFGRDMLCAAQWLINYGLWHTTHWLS